MKKIVAIAAFFLLIGSDLVGQDQDIRFGFQLSPSFSWMNTNTNRINRNGTNLGIKVGMLGEFYFRDNYAFATGLGFHFNAGGTLQHEAPGSYWTKSDLPSSLDTLSAGADLKYSIQYLEIPLSIKMRSNEIGYLRYWLQPGITLGMRTQAQGDITGSGIGGEGEEINIRDEVNFFNLALGVAGGIEYTLSSNTSLIGGLGVQFGVTDATDDNGTIFDPDRGDRSNDSSGNVNAFTIMIGILF